MKKQLFTLMGLCLLSLSIFSQNNVNLVIFSEDGDRFFAFINGIKQNNTPESNVKVTGLSPNINVRIEFEDKALPQLKQNMFLDAGFEHTAKIKRDMKKQLKMRYFGRVPMEQAASGVPTVAYHTANDPAPAETNVNVPTGGNVNVNTNGNVNMNTNGNINMNTSVTSSTVTTTKTNTKPENMSVNVSMAGVGINMNVNGMPAEVGTNVTTTTSSTVVTTQSGNVVNVEEPVKQQPKKGIVTPAAPAVKAGCTVPVSPASFAKIKTNVESKPFSDTKMSTAKIATKNACLSVDQIKEICKLFSMDDDKLEYAKYAYDYCTEKATYYEVSEVFSFSSTTDDFNKFLEK
ncbi:MAG: DUF4476 domain-containing protein [Bacteroidia bacterium]|nr:DUF4476 domain-containing protein [Bacteroidia bacterium]